MLFAVALAAAVVATPSCSWDRPGQDPFVGDLVAAVDHYTDLSAAVRAALKQRLAARDYDETVTISRDRIDGRHIYAATLQGMHFGRNQVCGNVTRAGWSDTATQRAQVICVGDTCIAVPFICGNLSRITRLDPVVSGADATGADEDSFEVAARGDEGEAPAVEVASELLDFGVCFFDCVEPLPLVQTPVPEPASWALTLAGLGGVAWVARRPRPS